MFKHFQKPNMNLTIRLTTINAYRAVIIVTIYIAFSGINTD